MDDDAFSRFNKMSLKIILNDPKITIISISNLNQIRKNVVGLFCDVPYLSDNGQHKINKDRFSGIWSKSPRDPMRLLPFFPHINLVKGFRIVAYQWIDDIGGYALVYGLPEGVVWPEASACLKDEYPFPNGAITDLASLLELDGSPESYIEAALFLLEVNEIGAFWHAINWGNNHFVGDIETLRRFAAHETNSTSEDIEEFWSEEEIAESFDTKERNSTSEDTEGKNHSSEPGEPLEEWKWIEPRNEDFSPRVIIGTEQVEVIWYTYSDHLVESLYRWKFIFDTTSRKLLERKVTQAAEGMYGFMY